ncbi:MAG: F0F1 ATP synthase subunit delta [Salinisphaera sp.]|jgi:F-type H+-transporting ATPase subunit delta|nr:F0F1 ATP synthase subunit delta [Salinisphaera sp.]
MAEIYTLARPYAEAVFQLAEDSGDFASWSDALAALSAVVSNEDVAALMSNPAIDDATLADAIIDIASDDIHDRARNLVRVLADNGRLVLAPAVAQLYEANLAERENRVDVHVCSAADLSDTQQSALTEAIEKRLSRKVQLSFERDESVIGGAVIRAGDLVIDGSLSAQLERMRQSLTH